MQRPPTLQEITQLTHQELSTTKPDDVIRQCGRAALSLLPSKPDVALKLAYQKLHDVPYKDVKTCWRRLHVDASLWKVVGIVEQEGYLEGWGNGGGIGDARGDELIDEVVRLLDMTLILTGAPEREEVVELWFSALKETLSARKEGQEMEFDDDNSPHHRPVKRRKLFSSSDIPSTFPTERPSLALSEEHAIPRVENPSLSAFQKRLDDINTHTPLIIEGAVDHWPALHERPWSSPAYLLEQTLGGRRLVPVEIGKSYTEEGWEQKIVTFREFMERYILRSPLNQVVNGNENGTTGNNNHANKETDPTDPNHMDTGPNAETEKQPRTGYLAQHDLFSQIPSLRSDISIPDHCFSAPTSTPNPHLCHLKPVSKLPDPLLNAWFGPAGTISPLHTDPYHNILVQVVGYKYIRLYAPQETERLYPRKTDEMGVDMSNTSQVDLDEAVSCWPLLGNESESNSDESLEQRRREFEASFPLFKEAKYVEGILGPGECLYLPVGWWHYVRSLTPSFSVSFWFN